jgi:hypothetical protein
MMNTLDDCAAQVQAVATFFEHLGEHHAHLPWGAAANDAAVSAAA